MSGLEPLNTGVKVQRLDQLGYIPIKTSLNSAQPASARYKRKIKHRADEKQQH